MRGNDNVYEKPTFRICTSSAPALADRFDDPMDYGVGFEDGTNVMTGEQNLEDLVSTRA